MPPTVPSLPSLSDPPALLAIARAAHLMGDRDLERAARKLLREHYGIEVTFRQASGPERQVADTKR